MAGHHVGQCRLKRRHVQWAGQAYREGDVVEAVGGAEVFDEPEALLGVGQRERVGAGTGGEWWAAGFGGRDAGGQRGHRRGLEEVADAQLGAQFGAGTVDDAGGEEGVAAEGEEVVVDADAFEAEDLGEDRAQCLFLAGARGPFGGGVLGCRQGAAVELAVGGQGDHGEPYDGRRDHVVGEEGARELT